MPGTLALHPTTTERTTTMCYPTYVKREVATLTVGAEFVDRNDLLHVVTGFEFHDSPGTVTVLTDLAPAGLYMFTTELVWTVKP